MTLPDLSSLVPTKYKPLVALIGAIATFAVPLLASVALPLPATIGIAVVLAVLTALGVHQAPYAPTGTTSVFVPTTVAPPVSAPVSAPTAYPTPAAPAAPGIDIRLPQIPGLPFQLPDIKFPFPGQFTNKWK